MRRPAAALLALLLVSAASPLLAAGDGPAQAVEKTFLIPSSDGYGVADCLTSPGSECGQVVANAWCESQGFASAGSYGTAAADEYTGAIEQPAVTKPADRPIRITCQD